MLHSYSRSVVKSELRAVVGNALSRAAESPCFCCTYEQQNRNTLSTLMFQKIKGSCSAACCWLTLYGIESILSTLPLST